MAITASSEGGNYTPVPAGNHVARCYQMVQIGTTTEPYKGEMKTAPKCRIWWELPNEQKEFKEGEGLKPLSISKEFTISLHEKANLRKSLESWRGKAFTDDEAKAFDITKLLGVPCMLNIIHETKDGKTFAKITNVSSVPKGLMCPDQINKSLILSYDNFDMDVYNSLPQWLKDKMSTTPEFKKISDSFHSVEFEKQQAATSTNVDDDLPF